jgi:Tfp pilus assembly protein PilF
LVTIKGKAASNLVRGASLVNLLKQVSGPWIKAVLVVAFVLGWAASAAAVDIRGHVFLPDGNPPTNPIRFELRSGDGSRNSYEYTDSNGRFILPRLSDRITYTLAFTGDDSTFGDTIYLLRPDVDSTPRVTLNPPPRKKTAPGMTISAGSGYKPDPKAASLYDRAMKEIENRQFQAAEPLLRGTVQADPKYAMGWNALGALLMQEKKYTEAEKPLRQALELNPKFITALVNLGVTLNHLGKYAGSVAPLREALRLQPDITAAHEHLGIALVETDQFAEAEQELKKALDTPGADEVVIQLYFGKLYARTGDFPKSIEAFSKYLEKVPNAGNADEVRGLIDRMKREMASRK